MKTKKIALLGSTGSIGQNTLKVIEHLGPNYSIVALAANSNIDLLERQAHHFHPELIAVYDQKKGKELQARLPHIPIVIGNEGLLQVATLSSATYVVSALVGAAGVLPTLHAIRAGKTICLANKEVLIAAGELIMHEAEKSGVSILPIDSEHSALFQCLNGEKKDTVRRLILTASGGPFRSHSDAELSSITPAAALSHPTWKMGQKVTIDCSTLMNKGLEVIEAHHLFGVPTSQIEVVIHPQSLIHSFVEFIDGSLLAQVGEHDMKIPIQYALTYPQRKNGIAPCFDFTKYSKMEFYTPDRSRFRCLDLAYEALKQGGSLPCFMNAVNEVLVQRFIQGTISWLDIGHKLEKLMEQHVVQSALSLETLFEVDQEARKKAYNF